MKSNAATKRARDRKDAPAGRNVQTAVERCRKIAECGEAEKCLEASKLRIETIRMQVNYLVEYEKWLEWLTTSGEYHFCGFVPPEFPLCQLTDHVDNVAFKLGQVVEAVKSGSEFRINRALEVEDSPWSRCTEADFDSSVPPPVEPPRVSDNDVLPFGPPCVRHDDGVPFWL